jgi:hypothetical protein
LHTAEVRAHAHLPRAGGADDSGGGLVAVRHGAAGIEHHALPALDYPNVMAGPNRFWGFKNDPAHEWLLT